MIIIITLFNPQDIHSEIIIRCLFAVKDDLITGVCHSYGVTFWTFVYEIVLSKNNLKYYFTTILIVILSS